MPKVSVIDNQVQDSALPSVRFDPNAEIESFGGGQSSQKLSQAAQGIIAQEKQKADDVATQSAYAKVVKLRNDITYNPNDGLYTKKGKDAVESYEQYNQRFHKGVEEIEKSDIKNASQAAIFNKIKQEQLVQFDGNAQRHVFSESQKYDEQTSKDAVSATIIDAVDNYQNPGVVQKSIAQQKALIDSYGERNGLPQETITKLKKESISKTHHDVMSRMLANNQDQLAKQYYERIKKDVVGNDKISIEKALQSGTLRGDGQRKADEIMQKAGTVTEGLEMARQIQDPDLRDAVVTRVKSRFAELKNIEKQESDNAYLQAFEMVSEDPSVNPVDLIDPAKFSKLSAKQQKALLRINAPGSNDADNWLKFLDLSTTDIASLSLSDFHVGYWSGLNEQHRKQATEIWNKAQKDAEDIELKGILSNKDRIKNSLVEVGLYDLKKANKKDKERLVQFQDVVDQDFLQFQREKGRQPNPDEVQMMIDKRLNHEIFIKQSFIGVDIFNPDDKKRLFELEQKDIDKAYIPINRVPKDFIEDMGRYYDRKLPENVIEKAYAALLTGGVSQAKQVIERSL